MVDVYHIRLTWFNRDPTGHEIFARWDALEVNYDQGFPGLHYKEDLRVYVCCSVNLPHQVGMTWDDHDQAMQVVKLGRFFRVPEMTSAGLCLPATWAAPRAQTTGWHFGSRSAVHTLRTHHTVRIGDGVATV